MCLCIFLHELELSKVYLKYNVISISSFQPHTMSVVWVDFSNARGYLFRLIS